MVSISYWIVVYIREIELLSRIKGSETNQLSTFFFRQNDDGNTAGNSLFFWVSGIIGTSEKKGGPFMPQSEMEALLQLQKETIESLRQLVESQRLTIEQMSKSHEEQTAQLNQTIANLNSELCMRVPLNHICGWYKSRKGPISVVFCLPYGEFEDLFLV